MPYDAVDEEGWNALPSAVIEEEDIGADNIGPIRREKGPYIYTLQQDGRQLSIGSQPEKV